MPRSPDLALDRLQTELIMSAARRLFRELGRVPGAPRRPPVRLARWRQMGTGPCSSYPACAAEEPRKLLRTGFFRQIRVKSWDGMLLRNLVTARRQLVLPVILYAMWKSGEAFCAELVRLMFRSGRST